MIRSPAVAVALALLAAACGGASSSADAAAGGPDGPGTSDDAASPSGGCDLTQPWFAPRLLPGVNGAGEEWSASVTADELTLYLGTDRDDPGAVDTWRATRPTPDDNFDAPSPVPELANLEVIESGAVLGVDGRTFTLHTFVGDNMELVIERDGVVQLLESLSSAGDDQDPWLVDGDRVVYFSTTRDGSWDVLRAERASADLPFGEPTPVLADPDRNELRPVVTADERTIFYMSETDVFMATRADRTSTFGPGVRVPDLSSEGDDAPAWVSADGCRILVSSDRAGGLGHRDIWSARRPPAQR